MSFAPSFLTFTGADERTNIDHMRDLARRFPIEWGILFSPRLQGETPRFPASSVVERIVRNGIGMNCAAHLCGGYARAVVEEREHLTMPDFGGFSRVQINHMAPDARAIAWWAKRVGITTVAQARGATFPEHQGIDWLFDQSGGKGKTPGEWPPYPGRFVGYAGGITPDNVLATIAAIDATGPYWLDMESGVRTDDWFDLEKVEKVCELVYGQ